MDKQSKVSGRAEAAAIPNDAIEALARVLYPAIRSYFESEEGQREFAEWQAQQGKAAEHGCFAA